MRFRSGAYRFVNGDGMGRRRRDFQGFHGSPEECRLCGGVATQRDDPVTGERIKDAAPGWCDHCHGMEQERDVRNVCREPKPVRRW